jgi:hypothetical protein
MDKLEQVDARFEKFPTREDIKTALENLNLQLDQRFQATHELLQAKIDDLRDKVQLLQEQFDRRFSSAESQTNLRIASLEHLMVTVNYSSEKAIAKADAANEKRFESVNEFRAQMADQSALFISRREVETLSAGMSDKIGTLTDRMNRERGRSTGIVQLAGWICGGVGLLVGLIAIFAWLANMQPKVERNTEFRREITAPAGQ